MLEMLASKIDKHIKIGGVDYFITATLEALCDAGGDKSNKISVSVHMDNIEKGNPDFMIVVNKADIVDTTTLFIEISKILHTITGVSMAPMIACPTPTAYPAPAVGPFWNPNQ